MHWREYGVIVKDKLGQTSTITFAEVATHNHFVLDRSGKIFKQTAPVIKLPAEASEEDHLGLLGLLNSSVACFWLQQVCHNKGGPGGGSSKDEKWHDFYAFNSTKVAEFPLVDSRPVDLSTRIDIQARQLAASQPEALLTATHAGTQTPPTRASLDAARDQSARLRHQMIAGQEELDWRCYRYYGLLPANGRASDFEHAAPPEVALGERAFEIVMARRIAAGTLQTSWFKWLGIAPITVIPERWPSDYRALVQQRIDLIESDRSISLMESPNCKRRWEATPWDTLEHAALREGLLARLELQRYWATSPDHPPQLTSTSRLADAARMDTDFMQLAALYAGHADFDPGQLVAQLVASEATPFLPVLRYTEAGLRKRNQWEDTWSLQRREDAGEDVGKIPVPPKYKSTDFLKTEVWRLRGGLDVPKERWISYPGC
ncbi:MAG: BREX-2 system adenine-specific DNA-methyltransferase PglX, partial [Polaromonas sp.]|nr:BREX-2 system adenine-specific DNA-methyltransferase PglX [Polaromonas sp.]